ncbi:unnamed protein product [Notodromas monacha]|uniref:Uncharacterized protein n=1 Tax=Notodromas monacha TaxID=399045 RepID=A0A7R9BS21_9CRUS|nr:unnamed protein product [Notodromas monacha]CAG0919578.1 unnamed protein product [Notodromas monacha]
MRTDVVYVMRGECLRRRSSFARRRGGITRTLIDDDDDDDRRTSSSLDDSAEGAVAYYTPVTHSLQGPASALAVQHYVAYAPAAPVVAQYQPAAVVVGQQHDESSAAHHYQHQQSSSSSSRYGAGYTKTSFSDDAAEHLEAHRKAVEEHQKAHALALQKHQEALLRAADKASWSLPTAGHSSPRRKPSVSTPMPFTNCKDSLHKGTPSTPRVTRAEAEYLHRDAIAKQQEMIRQQAARLDTSDESSYEGRAENEAQLNRDEHNEKALLARQDAEVQHQVQIAKAQGEQAKQPGAVEGFYRHVEYKDASGYSDSDSGSAEVNNKERPLPLAAAVDYQQHHQQQHQQVAYQGPRVSKEETERLHADAIKKQKEIIAQHEAFIASHKAGFKTYTYQQNDQHQVPSSSDESQEKKNNNNYLVGTYYPVNVVGPAPAAAAPHITTAYSTGQQQQRERAQLAEQDAEVRRQIQVAKEQGQFAAQEASFKYQNQQHQQAGGLAAAVVSKKGATVAHYNDEHQQQYRPSSSAASVVVHHNTSPVQYVYHRYARPTYTYAAVVPHASAVPQYQHQYFVKPSTSDDSGEE